MSLLSFALFTSKVHLPLLGAMLSAFTATDARFSFRKFSRIKRQIWGKIYYVSKFTIQIL